MGGPVHLARRFFGSLHPGAPDSFDVAWVVDHLSHGEQAIWSAMSNPDQRHSIQVARDTDAEVASRDSATAGSGWAVIDGWFESASDRRRAMVAAALMHDSGKNQSGLGTFARVGATLVRPLITAGQRHRWQEGSGVANRLSCYWRHPELGSEALHRAGSHRLVASWAAEHHTPPDRWTIPVELGLILRECDDD